MKDAESIEYLNAHGPYDHGLWSEAVASSSDTSAGNRGGLFQERAHHLVDEVCRILLENFSEEELSGMNIMDVGCYDGWVLVQIAQRIGFKSLLGVEPREKNIRKGIAARKVYGVETKVEFIQGEIGDLSGILEQRGFDVVLCLGTLHHVESTPQAVRQLAVHAEKALIIDTMVVDEPKGDAASIERLLNLRDVAYLDTPRDWAIAAYKYETPYFDGSAARAQIVNVPQAKLVEMSMRHCGFSVLESSRPDLVSYRAEFQKLRGVQEALIVGLRTQDSAGSPDSWRHKAKLHEEQFCFGQLDSEILVLWAEHLEIREGVESWSVSAGVQSRQLFLASLSPSEPEASDRINSAGLGVAASSILSNLSRAPEEKVRFELAKDSAVKGEVGLARDLLRSVTTRPNSDWRAFYRSCYFLALLARLDGREKEEVYYTDLLLTANPDFPLTFEDGREWLGLQQSVREG